MAKSKVLCAHCDAKITTAHAFCPNCKHPTVFATVEQRTAWELEQWTSKRTSPRKKVVAHAATPMAKPKRAPLVEQPAVASEVAAVMEPIKRVRTPRTIHPAVAALAARQAPAAASSEPMEQAAEEKRVIVLPEAVATGRAPSMKKPVRAPKKVAPQAATPKQPEPEVAKIEAAPKKTASPEKAAAPKKAASSEKAAPAATKPRRKAPKMAPMPIEAPVLEKNGNGHANGNGDANGNGNGYVNGNGHANGQAAAHDATAEQTEILRELLRRVTAIEEKMTAKQPRARRFRLLKR